MQIFTAQFLSGDVQIQLRWCDRFYSEYACWSFLVVRVKMVTIGQQTLKILQN